MAATSITSALETYGNVRVVAPNYVSLAAATAASEAEPVSHLLDRASADRCKMLYAVSA